MKILSRVERVCEEADALLNLIGVIAAGLVMVVLIVIALLYSSPCHAADYVTIVDGKGNAFRCNVQTKACKYQGTSI